MTWVLHITNAQNQFGNLVELITTAVRSAQERCESVTIKKPMMARLPQLSGGPVREPATNGLR